MGFGSFAGGLAKGFTGTYGLLSDIEEKKEEREFRRKERERQQQFRDVVGEEMGRVGQQPQGLGGQIRDQVGVGPEAGATAIPGGVTAGLREAAGIQEGMGGTARAQATALPTSTDPVTREQAMMRILERGAAIDPEKAFDFALKGMQLEDVLSSRKDKAEFKQWRKGFNTELSKVQELVDMADTDPNGFIAGVNKMGVAIRPVSLGGGKQVFEAYVGGRKVGQYNDLTSAAQDGMQLYTNNLLIQGAAKFAATPEQFVSILSTADRLDMDRRRLGFEERRVAMDEEKAPLQAELTRAQIAQVKATTQGANLAQAEKAEYNDLRSRILKLMENPTPDNQQELRQLARRAGILNPKEVLVTKDFVDADGTRRTVTTNVFTGEVQQSAREAGMPPPEVMAAARSGTNPVTGKPFTPAEIAEFERKYPNTPWPGQQQSALPTGGRRSGAAQPARPSPAATIRQASGLPPRIPEPPPREITRAAGRGGGTIRTPNPAYAEWERQYGEQYKAQQR
jgi:hypothetical protein